MVACRGWVVIESAANPLIKRIRALEQRKGREQAGACLVEGIQPVWHAVDAGAPVETLVVAPDLLTSEAAREMIARQQAVGVPVAEISRSLYERIAMRENPSGLAAIVRTVSHDLQSLAVTADALFVALHAISNPGNLGTILRTVDAVGGQGVILVGETTDPYHPNAVRASVGTLFRLPIVTVRQIEELFAWSRANGIGVVTTSARATEEHWQVPYPSPVLLLFGNEGRGLPEEIVTRGDRAVRIPMHGGASSLNLAVAAGVILYEALRQRRR